jgi:iron complex outermembrane receptor protein
LGFVLDGVPVYNSGAGYSNETIDSHDLSTLSVAPGTSTIDAPTIGSAAGTMYMTMRDPSSTAGVTVDVAGGTQSYNMQYLRADSGEIGGTGLRAFGSFSHTYADQWRGGGYNEKYHIDFKAVESWGTDNRISLEGSINRQVYTYYYYPTADQFAHYDQDFNNFNTHSSYQFFGDTSYFRLNQQTPSYAMVFSLPVHLAANSNLVFDDTPYFWAFLGAGTGGTVLPVGGAFQGTQPANVDLTDGGRITPTNGQVLVDSAFHSRTFQLGNVAKVTATIGPNTLVGGWWYEHYVNFERDPVSMVNQLTGYPINPWDDSGHYYLANGQPYFQNNSDQMYHLNSVFLGDTLKLSDKLKVSVGVKQVFSSIDISNFLPGANPEKKTTYQATLPQASIHYDIDDSNSVYADIEKDFRLPFLFSVIDNYSIGSGEETSGPSDAKPETALKEELGYRYSGDVLLADISLFNINLHNHLLTLTEILNGQYLTLTANAGNQTSRGLDLQLGTQPVHGFSPYFSFEYLHSTINSDIPVLDANGNQDFLPTNGKVSTQAPKYQGSLGLRYEYGPFVAGARVRWVARQYSSLTNDESLPSFIHDDFTFAYRFGQMGFLGAPKVQLNLSNIANQRVRSGANFTPFNAQDTIGTRGGLIPSSGSPTYYLEPSFAAVLSISTSF